MRYTKESFKNKIMENNIIKQLNTLAEKKLLKNKKKEIQIRSNFVKKIILN